MHPSEMIFGHFGMRSWNDFDLGSAMLGALSPMYVSFELEAPAKVFALQLKRIVAGYSGLGS